MIRRMVLLLIALTLPIILVASKRSPQKKSYKVSLIIPCHYSHAQHLYSLIKLYEQQTVLPNEVVISLSEADKVDKTIINQLQTTKWKFRVKVLTTKEKLFAGQNRNRACQNASGDIFICQDADDIPHPQRIEIIKYFFKKYDAYHVGHYFEYRNENVRESKLIRYSKLDSIPYIDGKKFHDTTGMTNGNVSISRKLFKWVKWSDKARGQDTEFNRRVYKLSLKRIVITEPLYVYRNRLTARNLIS